MVWNLIEPIGFGDFFPDGEFVGDKAQLAEYFNKAPAEFQAKFRGELTSYSHQVSNKWTYELGRKLGDDQPITPLEDHEKPNWFETVKRYSSLGSLVKTNNRLYAVDEDLKNIIERIDPGVHTFWPLQITMPKSAVYPKKFYGMVIGQFIDSFSPEQSKEGSWKESQGYYAALLPYGKFAPGLAYSKKVIGGANLWRERKIYIGNILFSDALKAEITKAGLRIPKHVRVKEVE